MPRRRAAASEASRARIIVTSARLPPAESPAIASGRSAWPWSTSQRYVAKQSSTAAGKGMLGREPIVGQQHAQPGQGRQAVGEPAIGARQMQTPGAAVQVEERAALGQACARRARPPGRRPASISSTGDRRARAGQACVHAREHARVSGGCRDPGAICASSRGAGMRSSVARAGWACLTGVIVAVRHSGPVCRCRQCRLLGSPPRERVRSGR